MYYDVVVVQTMLFPLEIIRCSIGIMDEEESHLEEMNMETIKIRHAVKEDLEDIVRIEKECFPPAEAADREAFQKRMDTFLDSFFVAEAKHRVVGFINGAVIEGMYIKDEMYENTDLHRPDGAYQSVFGIDVEPNYQGHRIASRLMETLIQYAKDCGRKGIVLTCKEALFPFYNRFGFENLGKSESVHGGAVWYDTIKYL